MKKLILFLLFLSITTAAYADWLTGWDKRIKITIDNSVVDSDLTYFPVTLILGTSVGKDNSDVSCIFDELTSDANRKKIAVTKNDGITQLYVEIEKWDDANEAAVLHISKSDWTVSGSSDTIIYLYYDVDQADNTTYVADSGSRTEIYDTNYLGVWHLEHISGNALDSTSNNNDGTEYFTPDSNMDAIGKINGADYFDGSDYITLSIPTAMSYAAPGTYSVWIKSSSDTAQTIFSVTDKDATQNMWFVFVGPFTSYLTNELIGVARIVNGTFTYILGYTTATRTELFDGNWHQIVITGDGSSIKLYLDGTQKTVTNSTLPGSTNNGSWTNVNNVDTSMIGARQYNGAAVDTFTTGTIDEVCVSNTALPAAWIKASYYSGDDNLVTWGSCEQKFIPKVIIY